MKRNFVFSGLFGILFIEWILLLNTIDVQAIGPDNTSVGFSRLNESIHELTGVNMLFYDITDYLGKFAILIAFIFALVGFIQLIKRKSFKKVDKEILLLGGIFLLVIGLYIFFEIFIINYRPIIMPNENSVEASFPSSHTMIVFVIIGSVIMILDKYVKNNGLLVLLKVVGVVTIIFTIFGRLISGVHWFTDIVGGILISISLLFLFSGLLKLVKNE